MTPAVVLMKVSSLLLCFLTAGCAHAWRAAVRNRDVEGRQIAAFTGSVLALSALTLWIAT